MITDQREETLREVCALGNIKAAQHFANSGVNLNSQNQMNGWCALHWASHRGHVNVVRLLLSNGANPNVKTHKDQTALDLARDKHPEIVSLLEPVTTVNDGSNQAKSEPTLPIVPRYLKEPDLEKSWLLPDEFSEARIENVVRQHQARKDMEQPSQPQQQQQQQQMKPSTVEEREILVYLGKRNDESIMGSVFLKNESIDASVASIKQELDGLPNNFGLARNNGKMTIPINSKQMDKPLLDIFRGEDDVLVIIPK
ncbi:ankyrin [Lichtheimia hyalospora FSU 10163]|nr:ankyrin [Lichtheimia hyalospora FSU 10163]